jgi:hypothetical protein
MIKRGTPGSPGFTVGPSAGFNGSHLQGYVKAPYSRLVEVFGPPTNEFGDKVTVEWEIIFDDDTFATIYDWKTEMTPDAIAAIDYSDWHIGGFNKRAVELVTNALKVRA